MVVKECVRCHKGVKINVTTSQIIEYIAGDKLIQDALPNLTPGEREMFITGICDSCWAEIFKDETEDAANA